MFRHGLAGLVAFGLLCAAPATAQLNLPQAPLQLPGIPSAPQLTTTPNAVVRSAQDALDPRNLLDSRRLAVRDLMRRHADVLETDPAGEPIVRGELIGFAPNAAALDAARKAGFAVADERALPGLEPGIVVLRSPAKVSTAQALERLRGLDPQGAYDFNHLYVPAGTLQGLAAASIGIAVAEAPAGRMKIGLVDGGVDIGHPSLQRAAVRPFGCATTSMPSAHGTAVASLLVGRARGFSGAAPNATLYAADVYCDRPTGGSASLIAEALAWMAREQVAVINLSLVGPANRTLERAVRTLIARGHVIVAAAGNDGPASPPLYPAAYRDVVAVTAIDVKHQVLPEAVRGAHIVFAAPGADMAVAKSGESGFSRARGTSFAAPLVAGLLAVAYDPGARLHSDASRRAIDALIQEAVDLGPHGRDETYGHGLVGERLRVDPVALR